MDPLFTFAASDLRRMMEQLLRTDGDFDAFVLDHFPKVKQRFAAAMDRVTKTNLLLEMVDRTALSEKLRQDHPQAFAYVLRIENGTDGGRQLPLPIEGRFVIGRGDDADIRICEPMVSRRHALLVLSREGVVIHREGRNSIQVNGEVVVKSAFMPPGCQLRIVDTLFRLEAGPASASTDLELKVLSAKDDERLEAESEASRLFWGLVDRLIVMNRIEDVERMTLHRLNELQTRASLGERPNETDAPDIFRRLLKLAEVTQKELWFGWLFDFARIAKFKIPLPLLDHISAKMPAASPPFGSKLRAYAYAMDDDELSSRVISLWRLYGKERGAS